MPLLRQRAVACAQLKLHKMRIKPAAMLESYRFQHASVAEPQRAMQPHRSQIVVTGDHRHNLTETARLGEAKGFRQQCTACATAGTLRMEVNRICQRKAVGLTRAIGCKIAVSNNLALIQRDQPDSRLFQAVRLNAAASLRFQAVRFQKWRCRTEHAKRRYAG